MPKFFFDNFLRISNNQETVGFNLLIEMALGHRWLSTSLTDSGKGFSIIGGITILSGEVIITYIAQRMKVDF